MRSLNEQLCHALLNKVHGTGTITSVQTHGGKSTVTSTCSDPACGAQRSGISYTNAAQACAHPEALLLSCPFCKRTADTPKAQSVSDILRIPENQRTSAQDRIVIEAEFARRTAQKKAEKQAPIDRAQRASDFERWDKFIMAHAHSQGMGMSDPRLPGTEGYMTLQQFANGSAEEKAYVDGLAETYFANNNLRY